LEAEATEGHDMFTRSKLMASATRGIVLATLAAMALTAFQPAAQAAGTSPAKAESARVTNSDVTDFGAARRHRQVRRGNGGAAAAAAFAGVIGTIGSIAAAQSRRDQYEYYNRGPVYYGGPGYYGGQGYYAQPGYYGHPGYYGGGRPLGLGGYRAW
jgi:hypothetical protein